MMGYRWRQCLIIEHPNLPGKATTAEKNFLYHRSSIGHAANTGGLESPVGYTEEQAYSWARASMYMGAKLIQNTGVVVITADDDLIVPSARQEALWHALGEPPRYRWSGGHLDLFLAADRSIWPVIEAVEARLLEAQLLEAHSLEAQPRESE